MSRRETAKESLWYSIQLTWTLLKALVNLTLTVLNHVEAIMRKVEKRVWWLTYRAGIGIVAVGALVTGYLLVTGGPTAKDKERLNRLRNGDLDDAVDFEFDVDRHTVETGFETAAESAQNAFDRARERRPGRAGVAAGLFGSDEEAGDGDRSADYTDDPDDDAEEDDDVEVPEVEEPDTDPADD